jgi:hypothetical protein
VAARLLESYAVERDVVPIATLAPPGMESLIRRGTVPDTAAPVDPVPVELISVGDHLLLTADALSHAPSTAVRDLRLFILHRTLATMPPRSGTGRFLSPLTEAITTAIGDGIAVREGDEFVKMLRECGRFLVDSGSNNDGPALARQRDLLAAKLITVELGVRTPVPSIAVPDGAAILPVPEEEAVVPIASLGYTEVPPLPDEVVPIASLGSPESSPEPDPDVVPIEALAPTDEPDDDAVDITTLAFDEIEAGIVPIAELFPDPTPAIPDVAPGVPSLLEAAYLRRAELAREELTVTPSLDGLIAMRIVPMETLVYRGAAAWARADEVRTEIRALLDGPGISLDQVRPFLSELLDLVPLARDSH